MISLKVLSIVAVIVVLSALGVYFAMTIIFSSTSIGTSQACLNNSKVKVSGAWSYKLSLNSTSATDNEVIQVISNLTNIAGTNQTINVVRPTILLRLEKNIGDTVWAFQPFSQHGLMSLSRVGAAFQKW